MLAAQLTRGAKIFIWHKKKKTNNFIWWKSFKGQICTCSSSPHIVLYVLLEENETQMSPEAFRLIYRFSKSIYLPLDVLELLGANKQKREEIRKQLLFQFNCHLILFSGIKIDPYNMFPIGGICWLQSIFQSSLCPEHGEVRRGVLSGIQASVELQGHWVFSDHQEILMHRWNFTLLTGSFCDTYCLMPNIRIPLNCPEYNENNNIMFYFLKVCE